MNKPTRYIQPLGPRVLVRIIQLEDRSSGGLYLPQGAKEDHQEALYGEVIEVARASASAEAPSLGENVSGVPLGAFVLFPKEEGLTVPWDDKLRLLHVSQVYAVVEEVEPGELQ
ncbi:co-chaperone GroES [Myxococcota bacterium]|nr:co-chaperone GroES [Myxococcota bacterium]MBU1430849.1 co-chaperone GroES [Myxococcota bacterium]MBU1899038.1 co-chaperone GroES [Myxococcota bacterium]